jgi:hypothetical protein
MYLRKGQRFIPCIWKCAQILAMNLESVHRSIHEPGEFARIHSMHQESVNRSIPYTWGRSKDQFHVLTEFAEIHSMYLQSLHSCTACPRRVGTNPFHMHGEDAKIHSMHLKSVDRSTPYSWRVCTDLLHVLWECTKIHSMHLANVVRSTPPPGEEWTQIHSMRLFNVHRSTPCPWRVHTGPPHSRKSAYISTLCTRRVCTDPLNALGECAQIHSIYLDRAHRYTHALRKSTQIHPTPLLSANRLTPCTYVVEIVHRSTKKCTWRVPTDPLHALVECTHFHKMVWESVSKSNPCPES